jgi:hypothetical protein
VQAVAFRGYTRDVRTRWELVWWGLLALAYAVTLGLSVWLVVDAWEPADGPRWEQWAFALGLAAVAALLAIVAAMPLWLRPAGPGWYVAAAVFAFVSALAAAILTFGALFLPAVVLFVLAAANVYAALRIGGLGRAEAAVGIVALIAVVWLTTGVYLPLVVLAVVVAVVILLAASPRAPVSRR